MKKAVLIALSFVLLAVGAVKTSVASLGVEGVPELFYNSAASWPEPITDFRILHDGTNLFVNLPAEFSGAMIELKSCSNLTDVVWASILETNAASGGVLGLGTADLSGIPYGGGSSAIPNNSVAVFYKVVASSTVDSDADGLSNIYEYDAGTDYSKWDTDGDWLSDGWEITNALNALVSDNTLDGDNDGLSNIEESQWGTDPNNTDGDADGMPDLWETRFGTNPGVDDAAEDPDSDGLENYDEFTADTNPLAPDTDEDGIPDGFEVSHGLNPLDFTDVMTDLDGDLVPNFYEYIHGEKNPSDSGSVPVPTVIVSTNGHDSTFTNIQNAIDSVLTNEYPIILIEPGNYSITEEVEVALANVLIYAASQTVVLDGSHSSRLFNLVSGHPVLAGLMIQNGYSAEEKGSGKRVRKKGQSFDICVDEDGSDQ